MAEQVIHIPTAPDVPNGEIVAVNVSADEYMQRYAESFHEWVKGYVIKMSPVTAAHDKLTRYLSWLFGAYLSLNPIGELREDPFVLRMDAVKSRRQPDLQIILNTNPGDLTETAMIGPADLVIEVVSPESVTRDYGEKLAEYEKGGVPEYWIVDSIRKTALFYRLNDSGHYDLLRPDDIGVYTTPVLPKLKLHVPTLWQGELPDFYAVGQAVEAMFK